MADADQVESVPEIIEMLNFKMNSEGASYAIQHYGSWDEIEDVDPELYDHIQQARQHLDAIDEKLGDEYDLPSL